MKLIKIFFFCLLGCSTALTQTQVPFQSDSLEKLMDGAHFILAKSYLEDNKAQIPADDDSLLSEWYIQYGIVNSILDEQDSAFSSIQKAIGIAERLQSQKLYFKANTQLIELYRRNRLYNQALFLIRKLQRRELEKDPELLARFFHRAAAVYNEFPQYHGSDLGYTDTAIALSELSLELSIQFDFEEYQATSLNELGNIYERTGYLKEARAYYYRAIELWLDNKDVYLANAVKNLGSYYLRREMPDSALYYFGMVVNIVDELEEEDHQIYADTYWGIKEAYLMKADSLQYYKYSFYEKEQVEQLIEDRLEKKIMDLSIAFEAREKDRMIQERNALLKKEEEQRSTILFLLAISGLISLVLLYLYFKEKKKNRSFRSN